MVSSHNIHTFCLCIFNDCVHSPIQPAVVTSSFCHLTTFVFNMCFYCVCEHIFFTFRAMFLRGYAFLLASIVLRFCFVRIPLHRFLLLVVGLSFCCKYIYLFVCFVR